MSKPIEIVDVVVVIVDVFFSSKTLGPKNVWSKTRPSSDSEAAIMYKLKDQSSNLRTGKGFS